MFYSRNFKLNCFETFGLVDYRIIKQSILCSGFRVFLLNGHPKGELNFKNKRDFIPLP